MSNSWRARTVRRLTGGLLVALSISLAIEGARAQQQGSAGANVNVISGTGADGDWTLQRQNEPTMACSSRNPRNCIAGANDYRTVDIPFPTIGEKITGDAWLGWYTTKDGGLSWRTRLLPGFPQDRSVAGLASPLKGYSAGADPIIRPGTNGLFYYGGLVFDREEGGGSAIFVARFIDNNNQEGTAGEPIDYLGTSIVQRIGPAPTVVARRAGRGAPATRVARRQERDEKERKREVRAGAEQAAEQMVDKPWMAVDIPRAGAQMCSIGGPGTGVPLQTFPGGRVYMAYALFDGPGEERGRIMFSRSTDCGRTWSAPRVISRIASADLNGDGVANSADVNIVKASYGRSCGQTGFNANADVINDCTINGSDLNFVSRFIGAPVPPQPRLSQGAALAINPLTGALQIAWRQFSDGVKPDAIVTAQSIDGGTTFTSPAVVATLSPFEQGTTDTSFRTNAFPTLAMDGTGRAYLAWSARGYAAQRPSPTSGDGRIVLSTSTNGVTWSAPKAVDNQETPGHQIMPALTFAQGKLQLVYYDLREDLSQLFGPFVDESPILSGPQPRIRHTFDVWGAQADPGANPSFTAFRLSQYRSGGVPGAQTVQQLEFSPPNLPIFRSGTSPFMGDYLDVTTESPFVRNGSSWAFNTAATASPVFHGIWTDNRDIRPPANGRWTDYTPPNPPFARPATSAFDPTQSIPACVPGQAGMRNQNIYTARITRGLVVGALGNSRRLGSIQRSFPVFAQNNATTARSYRLTIANQPVGGQASFKQFAQLATLDVQVPPRSTVARTVFARSTDPHAPINVSVVEIAAPGGAPVIGGQQGTIALNPDPTNPDLENPDLENPDLENPDLENSEVHNPDLENATVRNPDLENPDLENPDLENPDLENTTVVNTSILNPDLENPDLENPDLENPDLENPDLENVDLVNGALSDTTWTITNKGNTAGSYTVKLALNRGLPAGFRSQLLAHKVYQTPAALGCSLLKQSQTVLLANIPNPRFVSGAELANPDLENPDLENLTIAIAPGETARITLRVFDPIKTDAITFRAAESVTPVAVAQAVNTPEADQGITQPAVAGVLTSNTPTPGSAVGGTYATTLTSILPGTWAVSGGTVPPGLTVNPATGQITGTPTTPGTYTFTARFQSTTGLTDYRTVTITVGAVGAAANVGVIATGPTGPVAIGTPYVYSLNLSNAGPAAATNVRLMDTLPEGTEFVSATTTSGSCQHLNGTLVCNLGTLASGGSATVLLTVRPTIGGTHTNQVVVSSDTADPIATNNTATTTTTSSSESVTPCTTVCFSGPTSFIASPFDRPFGAVKGDFNEDGHLDLAYGPAGDNTLGIMLGNGAGGFGAPTTLTIPSSPDGGEVGDLNRDGHADLVIVSQDTPQAWLLLGNGLGGFSAPAAIALPNSAGSVAIADFNRDGNPDLAFGNSSAGALVMIRLGNGNGTFQPATTIGTTTQDSNVVVEDFNKDGNPDLALGTDGFFTIILGNGASGFQTPVSITVADSQGIIKVGDLSGDGFADLVVLIESASVNRLLLFVSNGSGGFAAPVDVGAPANVDLPVSADLDSDGDLDLVWSRVGGGVGIQLNGGSGNFAAPFYLSTPPVSLPIVADFNGDGRPDLALMTGGALQSQVLVFLNTCDKPPADLTLALQAPAGPVLEGSDVAYSIQVANNGPNPATGVQVDLTFSPNAAFVNIDGAPACTVVRTRVTCPLGTLPGGATAAITVIVRPLSGGTVSATAGVTGTTSDPNPANNAAFALTTVSPGASTLVVTNTNESGPGSLRSAIQQANDPGARDTITFNIPGAGVHTIRPTTFNGFPSLNQPVVIDATTQPGYSGTPLIEISGENAGLVSGLVVNTGNTVIRGLAINRFQVHGISVPAGTGNIFEANFIGTDPTGTSALPNAGSGIDIRAGSHRIGGSTAAARNVISGNQRHGIEISGSTANTNQVLGNYIGTNAAGTAGLGNTLVGVEINQGASNNSIGGSTTGAGNVLSGNGWDGVRIWSAGSNGNVIQGNMIGTNVTGTAAIANGTYGILLFTGSPQNTIIGGTAAGARNIISGNTWRGVALFGTDGVGPNGTLIQGNFIGTTSTGTSPLANLQGGVGIFGTSNNDVGGTVGNTIAFNTGTGVDVDAGTGNAIRNNSIFSNNGLGIDLSPFGVTANDPGDTDTGANNLLNRPVLSSARTQGATVLVQVALSPTPSGPGQIHFFVNAACDPSGSGEGQTPLGVSSFGVNAGGDTNFEVSFSAATVPAGSFLTATATDSGNNTSEFSACAQVAADAGTADLSITKQDSPDPVTVGSPLTYTIGVSNLGPNAGTNVTVTDVLPASVTLVSANSSQGSCSGTTTVTCTLGSVANGANVSVGIVVTPTAAGPLSNTATVTGTGTDPVDTNNTATTTTTVAGVGPLTFVVTNTLNSGAGSLRQAILDANARAGTVDTIAFAIPGAGAHTIAPLSPLPAISDPAIIDGTTQPGFAGVPLIELNGGAAPAGTNGLVLNGSNSVVRGLIINRFLGNGILVQSGTNNRIEGNWIGTSSTGTAASGNNHGVMVLSSGNTIGGTAPAARNVLSGNLGSGVTIQNATSSGNVVQGNFVGTDVTGTAAVPNQGIQSGVFLLNAPSNTIGGTATGAGNVISGNALHALTIVGATATGNMLQGNFIGTAANGTTPLGNVGIGIDIVTAPGNTIGGAGNARNVVANNGAGMQIRTGADNNIVRNNTIVANGGIGVRIDDTSGTTIGGVDAGDGNVIQNNGTGIVVLTATAARNAILGNSISGHALLGIDLDSDGITVNDANDIDNGPNKRQNFPILAATAGGVLGTLNSSPDTAFRIEFFGNAACDASGNGEGATFLGAAVVGTDGSGNATIPFFAAAAGQFVTATATDSSNNTSEFSTCVQPTAAGGSADLALANTDGPDPAATGSGLAYALTITNNGPGTATGVTITDTLPGTVTFVSASPSQGSCSGTTTITCTLGAVPPNTSATVFIVVIPTVIGAITNTATVTSTSEDPTAANNTAIAQTTIVNPNLTFVVTTTADSGSGSLRQALLDANAHVSVQDVIEFNIPGPGPHTITPLSFLPNITGAVFIDGTSQPGYAGLPLIELNGTSAGALSNGLFITAGNTFVSGLAINRFGTGGAPSANGGAGIVVQGPGSNIFHGNFLGTDPSGTIARPNRGDGIFIDRSPSNQIGGVGSAGNIISGNGRNGVTLSGVETTGTIVVGNFIGIDALGAAARANGGEGIAIFDSPSNFIGAGERNVISGNAQSGITISGATARFNFVTDNVIGANQALNQPVPNGTAGVIITSGASDNFIGGVAGLNRNYIAFNAQSGVRVLTGVNNAIRGNSIFQNGLLGIDIGGAGLTANDADDTDAGANNLQNFPVLTVVPGGVQGTFNGAANLPMQIDLFASPSCDASGNGEGANLLGSVTIITDAAGNATIPFFATPDGQFITATATDAANNTSEFSACALVTPSIALSLPNTLPIGVGRSVTATVTLATPAPAGGVVVTVTSDAPAVASIIAPGTANIAEGAVTGQVTVNGVSVGTTTLRANASGYLQGSLPVAVTQNLISTPGELNVAFGQSTALPVNIGPSPAPAGGLTLDVVSSNPSHVEVVTPQITVPAGALSANATVRGVTIGTANVTVSNPNYSPSSTVVSSSAELNILQTSASFNNGVTAPTLTVRLESSGVPIAAQPALVVTLTPTNAACVSTPASVTIPNGLVSATFQPAYGGTATLPCTTTVTASATGVGTDSMTVTVNPPPAITAPATQTLGAGLQLAATASLGLALHGGVTVTIASNNPAVLVAPNATTVGSASINLSIPNNQSQVSYTVQGLENTTGSATITISAPGFTSDTTTVTLVPIGVEIGSLNPTTTSLSPDDTAWYVQVGLPNANNTALSSVQNRRPGGPPFIVTLSLAAAQTPIALLRSDEPVASGQSVTKPIQPGIYYTQALLTGTSYGLTFDPQITGSTTVTVTGPPGVLTMTTTGARPVTISGPVVTAPGTQTVGAGLQLAGSATLGASQHGGVTVTIASNNPAVLVAPNATTVGTASINVSVPNNQTQVGYYVQGLENATGSATLTISAPGFASDTTTVNVVPIGVEIGGLNPTATTLSPDDTTWYVQVGLPNANNTALSSVQNRRPSGSPFVVTLSLAAAQTPIALLRSDEPVASGQSVTKPIQPGIYYTQALLTGTSYGLTLDPQSTGSTTVTVTGPPGVLTMTTTGVRAVTISGPVITASGTQTVGAGLQLASGATLGASQHGGVTVTIASNNAAVLVAPDATTPGTNSITRNVPNGQTNVSYYVQGLENTTGAATITISAPGFGSASHTVNVVPVGVEIGGLNPTTTNLSPDDTAWYVQLGLPNASNTALSSVQNRRPSGSPFIVTLTNSNPNVARLRSDEPEAAGQSVTKPIQSGIYYTQALVAGTSYGLAFEPLANGTTNVTVTGPAGVLTMTSTGVRPVTVTTPAITAPPSETIGAGLQSPVTAFLGATQHGGVGVTITSSAPSVVLVSPNATTGGTGSIVVPVANNGTQVPFVIQGVENVNATAIVTLSAPGFTSTTISVTITPAGIEIHNLSPNISAQAADETTWYVQVGIPNALHTALSQVQNVRAGGPAFTITLSLTAAQVPVAQLRSDQPPATGQSVTKPIQPGIYYTQAFLVGTSYGLAFDPLAAGTTTVTATGPPGVIRTDQASRTIVITP